jgi:hypothetical protein
MEKVIFIHIPKCGGTTINSILRKNYGKEKINRLRGGNKAKESIEKLKKLTVNQQNIYSVYYGHIGFGIHKFLKNKNFHYVTFLRNPIDRLISHYYYVLRNPDHYLYNKVYRKLSLKEYVSSNISHELYNGQTRLLCSNNGQDLTFLEKERLDITDLEIAKQNLENFFSMVGIVEEFDTSLILLKKQIGLKNIYYYKKNVTNKKVKENIDNDVLAIIKENNKFDLALYQFAKELFYKTIEKYNKENIFEESNEFQKRNSIYNSYIRPYASIRNKISKIRRRIKFQI